MNWIKVTKDIKPDLPIGTQLLIKTIHDGVKLVEVTWEYDNEFTVEETSPFVTGLRSYGLVEYSHYCVITLPKDD